MAYRRYGGRGRGRGRRRYGRVRFGRRGRAGRRGAMRVGFRM